jgi:uncharacterized membrane protein
VKITKSNLSEMFSTTHFHPVLVHFPIALILTGFLADLLFLWKKYKWMSNAGFFLMVLGTLGAIAAALSGVLFTQEPTEGEVVKIYDQHVQAAVTTLVIMIFVTSIRSLLFLKHREDTFRWSIFILYLLGAASVGYTGLMGGTMVYSYFLGI